MVRIAFLNLQACVGSTRGWLHYGLTAWKYFLPHQAGQLPALAGFLREAAIDVLGCAEMDGGSLRSRGQDYVADLAALSELKSGVFFPTQRLWRVANQGNSIHSRFAILRSRNHRLPGDGEARWLGEAELAVDGAPLTMYVTHLSLRSRKRAGQLAAIAERLGGRRRALLAGDFNTDDDRELEPLRAAGLRRVATGCTHPCWRPARALDHVFVSPDLQVGESYAASQARLADHLPLVVELATSPSRATSECAAAPAPPRPSAPPE